MTYCTVIPTYNNARTVADIVKRTLAVCPHVIVVNDGSTDDTLAVLEPLKDTVQYDAHGLPDSYPYMRYEVNEEYPQVKEVWRFQEQSNIVAGFAREGDTAY